MLLHSTSKVALSRSEMSLSKDLPIKILQFGEGNFLRAFIGNLVQKLNDDFHFNAGIAVVQPIERGLTDMINEQEGLYTLFTHGIKEGRSVQEKSLITNIMKAIDPYQDYQAYINLATNPDLKYIISNTTEAGIHYLESDRLEMQPQKSFPAKLTSFLFRRYDFFQGELTKGVVILPCELINYNADKLKEIILKYAEDWNLGSGFVSWLENGNDFCNTLVDRIVPGYPKDNLDQYESQLNYEDKLMVTAESFLLWVIEANQVLKEKLPFTKTNLDVKIVDDMQPYRIRKVRILNGAHTAMVPFSLLFGNESVRQTLENEFTGAFVKETLFKEIIPTLEMDYEELAEFSEAVLDRFKNPFIHHRLYDISLNSISKFKVRVLPSLLGFIEKYNHIPCNLTFSLACLITYYKGNWNDKSIDLRDDEAIILSFQEAWQEINIEKMTKKVLSNHDLWSRDLSEIPNLTEKVALALSLIHESGIQKGYQLFRKQMIS